MDQAQSFERFARLPIQISFSSLGFNRAQLRELSIRTKSQRLSLEGIWSVIANGNRKWAPLINRNRRKRKSLFIFPENRPHKSPFGCISNWIACICPSRPRDRPQNVSFIEWISIGVSKQRRRQLLSLYAPRISLSAASKNKQNGSSSSRTRQKIWNSTAKWEQISFCHKSRNSRQARLSYLTLFLAFVFSFQSVPCFLPDRKQAFSLSALHFHEQLFFGIWIVSDGDARQIGSHFLPPSLAGTRLEFKAIPAFQGTKCGRKHRTHTQNIIL